jgi:predicted DNA-binding protein YlxM (UPF0122 family)
MDKNYKIAMLLDVYGNMLTEKQRDVIELYYDEDYSLSEIAEHEKITRQGVHDSIKRGEQQLYELEEKLGLADKIMHINKLLENVEEQAQVIYDESITYNYSRKISSCSKIILDRISESKDIF